jgi:hypothetical protein
MALVTNAWCCPHMSRSVDGVLQSKLMSMVIMVFFGAERLLNWMIVESISTASLCLLVE